MRDAKEIQRQTHATRLQFINTELDLALTFASIAVDGGLDADKRTRNHSQAQVAYETATRLLAGADLSAAERAEVELKLRRIRTTLQETDFREHKLA